MVLHTLVSSKIFHLLLIKPLPIKGKRVSKGRKGLVFASSHCCYFDPLPPLKIMLHQTLQKKASQYPLNLAMYMAFTAAVLKTQQAENILIFLIFI